MGQGIDVLGVFLQDLLIELDRSSEVALLLGRERIEFQILRVARIYRPGEVDILLGCGEVVLLEQDGRPPAKCPGIPRLQRKPGVEVGRASIVIMVGHLGTGANEIVVGGYRLAVLQRGDVLRGRRVSRRYVQVDVVLVE